jgi:hypothetical protein
MWFMQEATAPKCHLMQQEFRGAQGSLPLACLTHVRRHGLYLHRLPLPKGSRQSNHLVTNPHLSLPPSLTPQRPHSFPLASLAPSQCDFHRTQHCTHKGTRFAA